MKGDGVTVEEHRGAGGGGGELCDPSNEEGVLRQLMHVTAGWTAWFHNPDRRLADIDVFSNGVDVKLGWRT